MKPTEEQAIIKTHVCSTEGLTLVPSVAGSGKTSLLVMTAFDLNLNSGLYLAYNKAIAVEASHKFPKSVNCCTTHSLAFNSVVPQMSLRLGIFNSRNITESISYELKQSVVDYLREFCLSRFTSFDDFAAIYGVPATIHTLVIKYLNKMQTAEIECTHDFYLKLFHIMLDDGSITFPLFDLVALDEAGDTNEVTLEIFKLLKASRKMMVGDPYQNIYAFNHTINCFTQMASEGTTLQMTKSFRVSDIIASKIQHYCNKYIDKDFKFEGTPQLDPTIKTRAFIARTNASLIGKMIELNNLGVQYGLTRTPQQIFDQPLSLCGLKYKGFISDPSFRHLQSDVNEYFEDKALRVDYKSPLAYLAAIYPNDEPLQQVINLIRRYSPKTIADCYEEARKHTKVKQSFTLGTAHSTKGLEFDEVTLADDLNNITGQVLVHILEHPDQEVTDQMRSEINLYYVACSRAKKSLRNAKLLMNNPYKVINNEALAYEE